MVALPKEFQQDEPQPETKRKHRAGFWVSPHRRRRVLTLSTTDQTKLTQADFNAIGRLSVTQQDPEAVALIKGFMTPGLELRVTQAHAEAAFAQAKAPSANQEMRIRKIRKAVQDDREAVAAKYKPRKRRWLPFSKR